MAKIAAFVKARDIIKVIAWGGKDGRGDGEISYCPTMKLITGEGIMVFGGNDFPQ